MPVGVFQSDTMETLHSVSVADPFRWLEDAAAPETQAWQAMQQKSCRAYFDTEAHRAMVQRVKKGLGVEVVEQPVRTERGVVFRRTQEGAEQACLWIRKDDGSESMLVDPSRFSPLASVRILRVSPSGRYVAYEWRTGGTDRKCIRVYDTVREEDIDFVLHAERDSALLFTAREDGILFARYAEGAGSLEVVFHPFANSEDVAVIFQVSGNPRDWLVLCSDGVQLGVIRINQDQVPTLDMWLTPATDWASWHQLLTGRTLPFSPILHEGRVFACTPKGGGATVVELDRCGNAIRTVLSMEGRIQQMQFCDRYLFLSVLRHGVLDVIRWPLDEGENGSVALPRFGTTRMLRSYRTNPQSVFVAVEGPTHPPSIWELRPSLPSPVLWHMSDSAVPAECAIRRYAFTTADGDESAMTVMGRGEPDTWRQQPIVLTVYGGFGIPSTPQYSFFASSIIEMGPLFGLVHDRREDDPEEQTTANRKNGGVRRFADDLLSAAAWLREAGIVHPERIGVAGGSHGGLVIALAMALEPATFAAVVCVAPLTDMVRYELFGEAHRWVSEYGTRADGDEFRQLMAISPYHRLEEGRQYPALLVVTGGKDERCDPAHAKKFLARVQAMSGGTRVALLDYTPERGHTPALPLSLRAEAVARRLCFLERELNAPERGNHVVANL